MLKTLFKKIKSHLVLDINRDNEIEKVLLGRIASENIRNKGNINSLSEVEFKVFSQFGEDGIVQYLISRIPIKNKIFIEFGVERYKESNTRFLLINNNWRGLLVDGNPKHIEYIKNDEVYWKYDITAICAFITRENINHIFSSNNFEGDIGLLSIDIDGNDYWVWEAIEVVNPRIVICEYNSALGCEHAVTVPYDPNFNRHEAHYSNLYFGASLPALYSLAERKGYSFIGCNSAGNNAFLVRKDLANIFKKPTIEEGYVYSKFRESRDRKGRLTYVSVKDRKKIIEDLVVYNTQTREMLKIKDL